MKNFINQFDTEQMGNILLFVTTGKLLICSKTATPVVEVDEGYFVLLPTEKRHIITAITDAQTVLMHAGTLSTMITEDPEWNPERPVVLPTFPSLAKTLFLLESYQKEKRSNIN